MGRKERRLQVFLIIVIYKYCISICRMGGGIFGSKKGKESSLFKCCISICRIGGIPGIGRGGNKYLLFW